MLKFDMLEKVVSNLSRQTLESKIVKLRIAFIHQENPRQLGLHGVVIFQGCSQGLQ